MRGPALAASRAPPPSPATPGRGRTPGPCPDTSATGRVRSSGECSAAGSSELAVIPRLDGYLLARSPGNISRRLSRPRP
eukprot:5280736-Pyramimonas_sp.AAC.1